MKQLFAALLLAAVLVPAYAASAFFTGNQRMVQTVTGMQAWDCEYNYSGKTFWRTFQGSCPSSVEVQ